MDLIDTHQHLILRGPLGYARANTIPALAGRISTATIMPGWWILRGRGCRAGSG